MANCEAVTSIASFDGEAVVAAAERISRGSFTAALLVLSPLKEKKTISFKNKNQIPSKHTFSTLLRILLLLNLTRLLTDILQNLSQIEITGNLNAL